MTKSISLNAKIDEIIKANEMKNEYQNVANVKVKEIIMSINITVNDENKE